MYIIIGADIVPTKSNADLFIKGDLENLVGEELQNILGDSCFRIFNLEVPLTDEEKPILKHGPNLIAPTISIAGYKALGVDLLTLANNHILDQDVRGLYSTINTLDEAGIAHLGAGENVDVATKPYIFSFNNQRVGVYACAEHEFSITSDNRPGANPFDPLWSPDHVEELKNMTDYVIVLYHGGIEHYRYPSPMLQKTCHRLVDKGADLVICQHSHCIGCEEKYAGGTIVYGQGNFLFDNNDDEFWQTSILIKLDETLSVSYIPIVKEGNGVRLADKQKEEEILSAFFSRSNEIENPLTIQAEYEAFASKKLTNYLNTIKGKEPLLYKAVNKISGNKLRMRSVQQKYDKKHLAAIWNWIDCEAHRELLICGIRIKTEE